MASSSTSGVCSGMQQQQLLKNSDESKLKRMVSNRESAKRSRIRKQKHLDDLMTQMSQLKCKNDLLRTNMSVTSEMHVKLDAENSVLRAQLAELSQRLESLNQIMDCMNSNNEDIVLAANDDDLMNLWNIVPFGTPIEASADVFM